MTDASLPTDIPATDSPPIYARLYCRNPDIPGALATWYCCDADVFPLCRKLERILRPHGPVLAVFDGGSSSWLPSERTLPYCGPCASEHG